MRNKTCGIPSIGNSSLSVYSVLAVIVLCLVFASGAWAQGTLLSGSLSTPILFDSNSYGIVDYDSRPKVANPPGGLISTAAWYDYGMELSWEVSQNSDNTYNYKYTFGPGWYPASNPKGDGTGTGPKPYVTNKNITAFDLQLGSFITSLSQLTNLTWDVYQFNGPNPSTGTVGRIGTGDATGYWLCDYTTGSVTNSKINTPLISIGDLQGETGWTDQNTLEEHYVSNDLFHGFQWLNPLSSGNWVFSKAVTIRISFTSSEAPGWGNFFANSTRTGSNNNQSDVVAYNSSDTGYDPTALNIPVNYNNTIAVPGGIQDSTPPTVDSTSPANGASDVSIGRAVTATFSEPVEPSTAIAANFTLSGGGGQVTGTVSYDAATRTITFAPQTPLLSGTSYTASIMTGIKDLHDNSLAMQYNWSFTTKVYDIADALRALHITVGLITPNANDTDLYDVVHSTASSGTINVLDVLMILRRVVEASP